MKEALSALVVIMVTGMLCPTATADAPVFIEYSLRYDGAERWAYTYSVNNVALATPIEEFTIYFDFGFFQDLTIRTEGSVALAWDELVVEPEPFLAEPGFYDALSTDAQIPTGEGVNGFSVSFTWLGIGSPGPQSFEIVDPRTFEVIYTGITVPEPSGIALVAVVLGHVGRRRDIAWQLG